MKYNKNNKPLVCMMTQSTCYKGTHPMDVKGVLWHSTGANNTTLKRYVQPDDNASDREALLELLGVNKYHNDWNHIECQAGLNCWIGKLANGTVTTVQTMPWDFKPWGCGTGKNGSCNNGWIQFEICEDALTDKDYFTKVYTEACEITAYLCEMFNIDPNGTVDYNGIQVPTILCHYDSYKLGLGSNHGDIDHWFPKFGKSMKTAREDVAKLMNKVQVETPVVQVPFKKGQAVSLRLGATYSSGKTIPSWVFEKKLYVREIRKNGDIVFSTLATGDITGVTSYKNLVAYKEPTKAPATKELAVGDEVKLTTGAIYFNGQTIPSWLFTKKLYVREKPRANGDVVISTLKTGAITGVVNKKYLMRYNEFESYKVVVDVAILNVRANNSTSSAVVTQIKRGTVHTVLEIKEGWGRIDSGWIYMAHVKKL